MFLFWWNYNNETGMEALQQKVVELVAAGATEIDCSLRWLTTETTIIVLTAKGQRNADSCNNSTDSDCPGAITKNHSIL